MTNANTVLTNLRRKLEGDLSQMHADLENLAANARNSEEKARKVSAGLTRKCAKVPNGMIWEF